MACHLYIEAQFYGSTTPIAEGVGSLTKGPLIGPFRLQEIHPESLSSLARIRADCDSSPNPPPSPPSGRRSSSALMVDSGWL